MELRFVLMLMLVHTVASIPSTPKITIPDKKITTYLLEGVQHTLTCKANGNPTPTYTWKLNNKDVNSSNIKVNPTTGRLDIISFTSDEEGDYMCIAENELSPGKGAAALSSVVTLKISKFGIWKKKKNTGANITYDEGSYVRLACENQPVSVPEAQYSWYLAEEDVSEGEVKTNERIYVDAKGTLHFMYITKSDDKGKLHYKCGLYNSALNIIKLVSEKVLNVKENPAGIPQMKAVNQYHTEPANFLLTKDAELECVFSGYPIPSIVWYRNNVEIQNSKKHQIVPGTAGRKLLVKNVSESDEVMYACKDSKAAPEDKTGIFLNVISGPIWQKSLSSLTKVEGSDAMFTCIARPAVGDSPLNKPVWFKNGEKLPTRNIGKLEFSNQGRNLTVKNVNKTTDIMCFQCNVSNSIGYEFADGCLNVIEAIVITEKPALEQTVAKGDMIYLTVIGTTDPAMTLKYRWRYNNVTYDKTSPPYVTYNETTLEAYINTSALTDEEFRTVNGTYYRQLYHQYEVKTVPITVTLDIPVPKPIVATAGASLWWLPIVIALLIIIIIVIIIACVVCYARERGTYPLDKKERANDMDPEKDLADGGFHELSRAPGDDEYPGSKSPLVNPNFDYDDDDDNPEKDDESLDAYGADDPDQMLRFGEEGSFIGQYGSKKGNTKA